MSLLPTRDRGQWIAWALFIGIAGASALKAQELTLDEPTASSMSADLAAQWERSYQQPVSLQWDSLAQAIEAEAAGRTMPVTFQTELPAASGQHDPVRQSFTDSLAAERHRTMTMRSSCSAMWKVWTSIVTSCMHALDG